MPVFLPDFPWLEKMFLHNGVRLVAAPFDCRKIVLLPSHTWAFVFIFTLP